MVSELKGFSRVCNEKELKESTGTLFYIDDVEVAVFKINDVIYALNNICPHQHSAIIYDGFFEDGYVVCPAHGWEFNLKTGNRKSGCKGLDSYEVKVINGEVFVKVNKKELRW